jgi:F-type H+-transporting ATPase subunit epsilon
MPTYEKQFCVEVLTPNKRVTGADAVMVVIPAADGQIGVLARHMPLVALHGAGVLAIQTPDGKLTQYFISGGFTRFISNAMTVLAEICHPLETLKEDAIRKELETAKALPADNLEQRAKRIAAIELASAKLVAIERTGKNSER